MTADLLAPLPAARAPWLMTLADLALLLVGFLVLVEATRHDARGALATGLRARFAGSMPVAAPPMPVAAAIASFPIGSAMPTASIDGLASWAADTARDPRTTLTITGTTDGTAADVDRDTGSAAVLAADRARAVAGRLAAVIPARRLIITTDPRPAPRAATVTLAFAGAQKDKP